MRHKERFFWIFPLIILILFLVWLSLPLQIVSEQKWVFYDLEGELLFSEKAFAEAHGVDFSSLESWVSAVEDQDFRSHLGVDLSSVLRAAIQNVRERDIVSGASTITMQVVRQNFLENERHDLWYKLRQALLALRLDAHLSKGEIFQLYAKQSYFGNGAVGFDGAARRYFSKDIEALTLGERAVLVGILPRPDTWNPLANAEKAEERKDLVLNIWQQQGLISTEKRDFWQQQEIALKPDEVIEIHAPHFVLFVKDQLENSTVCDVSQAAEIRVQTTVDKSLHQKVLKLARDNLDKKSDKNISNASAVVLDEQNEILTMLGSTDFFDTSIAGNVNLTTASREMGSTLKPFLFTLALENGLSPADEIIDERKSFLTEDGSYAPQNYRDNMEYGHVRFREALTGSYNISAVTLLDRIGIDRFFVFLEYLGFHFKKSPDDVGLALVLGSGESRLLDLASAFSMYQQKGIQSSPRFFSEVRDENDAVICQAEDFFPEPERKISLETAEWILHALSDREARWRVFSRSSSLDMEFDVAVKTGTSQDFRDNYTVGSTSEYTVGVWVGNADGTPMHMSSGNEGAGPFWRAIMRELHPFSPPDFKFSSERDEVQICRRPFENMPNCSEKIVEFLLPEELTDLQTTQRPEFAIAFPNEGDRFHPDSKISVKTRGGIGEVRILFDGVESGDIIEDVTLGEHEIMALSGDERAKITILVE
ncbi:MAG: transglycosylase domain-containing protein [Candidatus Peribacteraceae bacterium]|nr:transglycosylase domain-containing protein [Candidatus Peribacteraceae bacterium]